MRTRFAYLERTAIEVLPQMLAKYLGQTSEAIEIDHISGNFPIPDMLIHTENLTFVAEVRARSDSSSMHQAVRALNTLYEQNQNHIPLLIVPFMGSTGRKICEQEDIPWIDLSGNAHISLPNLHVHVEGKRNKYVKSGRPGSAFSPKSARITRWLLAHPEETFSQREISNATDLYEGYTSRIVKKLESDDLINRDSENRIYVPNRSRLIEAWREDANFSKNTIIKGHLPVTSGDEAMQLIAEASNEYHLHYAATGLAGAWQINHFANYRLCTVYINKRPSSHFFDDISFRETAKGANVWFVLPKDEGVFQCEQKIGQFYCVHPVQVYIDLKDHPERSEEAAESLLNSLL